MLQLFSLLVIVNAVVGNSVAGAPEVWRLGLQRWNFGGNCTGLPADTAPCEPPWRKPTPSDWAIHGLWPGPSASSTPPAPETLDCDNSSALNTSEAWLRTAVGPHLYTRMLLSWSSRNQPLLAGANIVKPQVCHTIVYVSKAHICTVTGSTQHNTCRSMET